MPITVKRYTPDMDSQYEQLLQVAPVAMFNHSLRYRDFLKEILPDSEDHYLCAFQDGQMVAVLPAFVHQGPYGAVVNSLPFYGSHGGFVYREPFLANALDAILDELDNLCRNRNAFSCTLIESPRETNKQHYLSFNANMFDERIGQMTPLPLLSNSSEVEHSLLSLYHQKTRNMVRKGLKGGFQVTHDGSLQTIKTLHSIHDENIRSIGGIAKSPCVFEAISKVFQYDCDYRIYIACRDGQIVSALLLFYFQDTVEYFTPATLESFRSEQPLSLLIFTAMRDAIVERGARFWNWGGTWHSQSGVYQFKSRWGTKDYPYRYHIRSNINVGENRINKAGLTRSYPLFYCMPFSALGE